MPRRQTIWPKPSNWKPIRLDLRYNQNHRADGPPSLRWHSFASRGAWYRGEEVECPLPGIAIRRAQAMSTSDANAGAVAFVRQSPDLHTFGDATATVLKTLGEVTEDFDHA